jgi:predicted amidohydrolase
MRGVWSYARGLAWNGTAVATARLLTSLAFPNNSPACKIAIVQMCSSSSVDANTISCLKSIETAAANGAKMVFFPECFLYISGGDAPASQPKPLFTLDHPVLRRFRQAASAHNVWLSLGGFASQHDESDPRARNAHALIAADGSVAAVYNKIHLFDAQGKAPSTTGTFLHAPQPR